MEQQASDLESQARTALRVIFSEQQIGPDLATPIINLSKLDSDVPRSRDYVYRCMTVVLEDVQRKFGSSGMQKLASELRNSGSIHGITVVAKYDAFPKIAVIELENAQPEPV